MQTISFRTANYKRNRNDVQEVREQIVYRVPVRDVTETTSRKCASTELTEFQLETLKERASGNVANEDVTEFHVETLKRRNSETKLGGRGTVWRAGWGIEVSKS